MDGQKVENMDTLLDTVLQNETQAVIQQNQQQWIPSTFSVDMSRSLLSFKTSDQAEDAHSTQQDYDDDEFPYDKADPSRKEGDLVERNSEDNSENDEQQTDVDSEDEEDNGRDETKVKEVFSASDWNTAMFLASNMRRNRADHLLDAIPEADYGDSIGEDKNRPGKTESPEDALTPDYEVDGIFDFSRNAEPKQKSALTKPAKHAKPAPGWSDSKPGHSKWNVKNNQPSEDFEMKSFTPPMKRNGRNVGFRESVQSSATNSSLQEDDPLNLPDLAKLHELTLDTITDCVQRRYEHDLIYTRCGEVLISVNPFKPLELCSYKYFEGYTEHSISDTPHLFSVSAKAYQGVRRQQDQVILVSGESGSGKTEATKYIVHHLMHIAGSEYETLQDRIIQINPLLEAFGNAKTKLNKNSSRFAKLLTLNINTHGKIESARVKEYMLEKSRVVHHHPRERTFHSFYTLLVGASDEILQSLFIKRHDKFRVTGDFTSASGAEKLLYQTFFDLQQDVFKLIKLTQDEIRDIYTILAAILHLGNVEFETSDNDSVVIKDESIVYKVATLLQLDVKQLAKVLIERTGRMGKDQKTLYEIKETQLKSARDSTAMFKTPSRGSKADSQLLGMSWDKSDDSDSLTTGEIIELSKNKQQAEDERDATAKSLYERLFGWLVTKINASLKAPSYLSNSANIGILDICGFENLGVNSFEQLCINLVNEQLQNFMNKTIIEDEKVLYLHEGVDIGDVETEGINNDAVLRMFMEKKTGILATIDEDSKLEISNDEILVSHLATRFGDSGIFIPPVSNSPEFRIRHFAGEVNYDARSFIQKNRDTMSESMKECFSMSESTLIQDLFSIQEFQNSSISMANFHFRGSRKTNTTFRKPVLEKNLSQSINKSRKQTLQQKFGERCPTFQTGDLAQRSTHIKFFRNSMDELLNAMRGALPYFVRCIKPNDVQLPGEFSREKVKTQLQYNGVKEIARIRTFAYPVRLSKDTFKAMYGDLTEGNSKSDVLSDILNTVTADESEYKIGRTQIFMKEPVKTALDLAISEVRKKQEIERKRREEKERQEAEKRRIVKEGRRTHERAEQLKREINRVATEAEITHISPLERFSEIPTPASLQDDPVYNKVTASSSSNEIPLTSEESDEDSSEETSVKTFIEEEKDETPTAPWDITQELTVEEERLDVHEQPILMVIKFIVYIILFVVLLGTFVIQKVGFLLMTTNLKGNYISTNQQKFDAQHKHDIQTVFFVLLVIAICIPYALGWLLTVAKLCFGNFKRPSFATWIWVLMMENLHTVGLCLLVFRILPSLDVFRSSMLLSATAVLPAILKVVMSSSTYEVRGGPCIGCNSQGVGAKTAGVIADVLVMLVQVSVIPLIILMEYLPSEKDDHKLPSDVYRILEIVGSFILVSFAHWENFTDGKLFCELGEKNWFKNAILKIKFDLQNGRHYPHLITYLSRIGLTVLMGYLLNEDASFRYEDAFTALSRRRHPLGPQAIAAAIALIISAFVAFYASFGACMFQMQVISLTIPAFLAAPVTFGIFCLNYQYKILDFLESDTDTSPEFVKSNLALTGHWYHFLFGAAWWLSLVVLNRHMLFPKVDRTANMARVFINPNYCGILTYESIMLNRIRNPRNVREDPKFSEDGEIEIVYYKLGGKRKDDDESGDSDDDEKPPDEKHDTSNLENPATPMLYACATMWHETRTEMVQLLKSLHRLDRDQYIRRLANERVQGFDPEFYNFEAHIFFDDAMEPDDNDEQVPNGWVKELVSCMDIACSSVHGKPMKVHPPTKVPTPYGGQLIWQMPGENLLFVHMKDIKKIRNRKRWSQVMYMYYLLGYRHIMASKQQTLEKMKVKNERGGRHGLNINEINYMLGEESAIKAQNTFLLALDGDTDFSPGSIKILLDRMKDEKVGAACGRIHPIGNGPMIWYQKFEYAIGHWLQKAAEHVFGCVLCSPGCFSLFRASALMDTNVMKKYTTEPTQPSDHLQYDQGEDRWLCTLLLQQGYRIEYAAAADAWTFAPEGFFEFFNQRRRWMPSTIANILDLLGSASQTTKRNANMSILYIGYQWLLMLMTILGPGTILMMIAGAVKLVFKFSLIGAYAFSTVPAAVFIVVCFWLNSRMQLIFAAILSVVYSFIMMMVLVGTIITASTENIFHPSVIVIVVLIGIFVVSGFCHPQEVWCLVHGVLYLLTIPSGYLLLVIYSIINLNDVSWGTREVPTKAQRLEMEQKKKEKEEQEKLKPKKGFLARIFNSGEGHIRELKELIKTLMPKTSSKDQMVGDVESGGQTGPTVIELLSQIEKDLQQLLKKSKQDDQDSDQLTSIVVDQPGASKRYPTSLLSAASIRPKELSAEAVKESPELAADGKKKKRKRARDELKNPLWAEDRALGGGVVIVGNKEEIKFWSDFVTKYLLPIRPTPEEKKKIADGLRDLRNSSAFGLIILNLLWMAVNFMFQLTNAAKFSIQYSSSSADKIEESVLGMGFVFLLLLLLFIQMFGMFIHRMGTLQHLLAITVIKICKAQEGDTSNEKRDREDVIRRIKEVLKIPMTGDVGIVTQPPPITPSSERNWGLTVMRTSARGTLGQDQNSNALMKHLGQTIGQTMLAGGRSTKFDWRTQETLNIVKQRLLAGNALPRHDENGDLRESFRPRLPPRGRSLQQPMMLQANNWGFTQRELAVANVPVINNEQHDEFQNMGAMGKSILQRSKLINETTQNLGVRKSSATWSDHDAFSRKRISFTADLNQMY